MADIHSVAARRESVSRSIPCACRNGNGCPCVTLPHGCFPAAPASWPSSRVVAASEVPRSRPRRATSIVSRVPHRNSIPGAKMPENDITVRNWRKSSASGTSDCVEVASFSESVLVRDSKQDFPHVLRFTPSEWRQFLSGLRTGKSEPGSGDTSGPRALQWLNWAG